MAKIRFFLNIYPWMSPGMDSSFTGFTATTMPGSKDKGVRRVGFDVEIPDDYFHDPDVILTEDDEPIVAKEVD